MYVSDQQTTLRPSLTNLPNAINYTEIFEELNLLTLEIYTPSKYIFPSRLSKYIDPNSKNDNLTRSGREEGIRRLMTINLMKRLESFVHSFNLTLGRIRTLILDSTAEIGKFPERLKPISLHVAEIV